MNLWSTLGISRLWRRARRRPAALIASIVVTIACLWLLERGALPVLPNSSDLAHAEPWALPAYAGAFCLVLLVRAVRWQFLVKPLAEISAREVIASNFVFFAAVFLLPMRLGEVVRPALLRRPERLSAWQVVGLVGAERVVDGLMSSSILAASLLLAPMPPRTDLEGPAALVRSTAFVMLGVFGAALLGVVLFFFFRRMSRRLVEAVFGLVSKQFASVLADKVETIAAGLEFLRVPRFGIPFLIVSALYWLANTGAVWLLLYGCGVHDATWAHAGTVIGVLALGLLIPGGPGFFGTYQLSAFAGLSVYLASPVVATTGSVVVFFMYVVQVVVTLVLGAVSLPASLKHALQTESLPAPSERS